MPTTKAGKYIVRHADEVAKERSTCGYRQRLLSTGDDTPAYVHVVKIDGAKPHYHKKTSELYYILEGSGVLVLDGDRIEIRPGSLALIEPNVVHAAEGDMLIMVVGLPKIDDEDLHFPDEA